ncbi:MAG: ScyD/ScyE family protein [Chloroflexi bacterium]|nr:ScyD/ScyE family protein [Chloroflexota bacterium]
MVRKMSLLTAGVIILLASALFAGVAFAQGGGKSLAKGLNGPQGVLVAPDGQVWVIDSGIGGNQDISFPVPQTGQKATVKYGNTARVVRIGTDGKMTDVVSLPSIATGADNIGGARLALLNGMLFATNGQYSIDVAGKPLTNTAAIIKIDGNNVTQIASTWEFEKANNPGGFVVDSHPYGLAAGPDGKLWVADAGGNDLLKVDAATGKVELVAAFPGIPSPIPNANRNNALETDPVPTGVTFDKAGNAYVSLLSGFPFTPGSSKVVKVASNGQFSDYATGLTMLTDIRTAPDGNMYAVQFGIFTDKGPTPNSGAVIRIKEGKASEVVAGNLSFPTSIDFNANGDAYVTINGQGAPGSGEVLMFAGLTKQPGTALTAVPVTQAPAAAAPAKLPVTGDDNTSAIGILLALFAAFVVVVGYLINRRTINRPS